ncbi:MAG: type 1 glutamine amidotransferase [Gammaproteobacteria bacterium]|nr:type 1 glutamine amidotransferase [Gammaproteobacteria bacterium]
MKPILVFTHDACEPPGYIRTLLERLDYPCQQVCLLDQDYADGIIDDKSAIVLMGGPGDVNQPTDWMQREMQLIRRAEQLDIPILGVCLGAQLMSKAIGGDVQAGATLEVGWHPIELLPAAHEHPWFAGLPASFTAFQWHAHIFSPPPGAQVMATNHCAQCQAYAYHRHLALQFHLEMNQQHIHELIEKYSSDLDGDSACVHSAEQILQDIDNRCEQAFAIADQLIGNWFKSL